MVSRDSLEKLKSTAQTAAVTATLAAAHKARKARYQLDQALLDLQHERIPVLKQRIVDAQTESADLVQRLGRGVLERAQEIRATLVQSMLTPAWLREISQRAEQAKNGRTSPPDGPTLEFTPMAPESPSGLAGEIAASLDRLLEAEEARRQEPRVRSPRKSKKNQA